LPTEKFKPARSVRAVGASASELFHHANHEHIYGLDMLVRYKAYSIIGNGNGDNDDVEVVCAGDVVNDDIFICLRVGVGGAGVDGTRRATRIGLFDSDDDCGDDTIVGGVGDNGACWADRGLTRVAICGDGGVNDES
jgi:hypothetical protein